MKTQNFFRTIETSGGPRVVHVNRRGCRGPWTEASDRALEELVRAVVEYESETRNPPTPSGEV